MRATLAALSPARALVGVVLVACGGDVGVVKAPVDGDGDGYLERHDCDDGQREINPSADELCDGIDNDCDGEVDEDAVDASTWWVDADADGFGAGEPVTACDPGPGYAEVDGDCDDADPTVSPAAAEVVADGIDQDCSGADACYADGDADGFAGADTVEDDGDGVCDGPGEGATPDDCADADADTFPGAAPLDDASACMTDADGDDYGSDAPAAGVTAGADCDDTVATTHPGAAETWYDGVDADCDGASDYDADSDGYDATAHGGADCDDAVASTNPGVTETWYDGVDADCDGASDYDADSDGYDSDAHGGSDCDDALAATNPGATETWYDGTDTDCDGASDYDADSDGYDASAHGGADCDDAVASTNPGAVEVWYDGVDADCDGASDYDADSDGYDASAHGGADCDDAVVTTNPGATETWYDGVDADCDGASDYDADLDGYDSDAHGGSDCDDALAATNPGATETWYDGTDTDCDGASDYDADADGYDSDAHGGTDCDDAVATTNPGASETWYDGVDADCDGASDYDADSDGYDATAHGGADCDDAVASTNPGAVDVWYDGVDADCDGASDYDADSDGYDSDAHGGSDCDDALAATNPGATEIWYDGTDTDCDGASDYDADADGYDSDAHGGTDCDDTLATTNPGVTETWYDGVDADCDGASDYDADADGHDSDAYSGTDCDDTADTTHPDADDTCGDGIDQDCDGSDSRCGPWGRLSSADSAVRIIGDTAGDAVGVVVGAAGDVDGNGHADVLVSAPHADTTVSSGGLAWLFLGPLSGDVSVADAAASFTGTEDHGYLGQALGGAGDLDGDGTDDVVIGAPYVDGVASGTGDVYAFLGPVTGSLGASDADITISGTGYRDYVGETTADEGDANGDGQADLLVSARGRTQSGVLGSAFLLLGPITGDLDVSASQAEYYSTTSGDGFGWDVSMGDVDGDGLDDVAVSGRHAGSGSAGTVFLFLGPSTGTRVMGTADAEIQGTSLSYTGYSISLDGDVDGDGLADLLVGSPLWDDSYGTQRGWASLWYGPVTGTASITAGDATIQGGNGYFGWAADIPGDVDGDGNAEIMVTDWGVGGDVYVLYGPVTGSHMWTGADARIRQTGNDFIGYDACGAGDVDADGQADLLIGARGLDAGGTNAGGAYIWLSSQ